MICLLTNTPEFYSDLCDEIRLFFDVRKVPMVTLMEIPVGHCVCHMQKVTEDSIVNTTTLYVDGKGVNTNTYTAPLVNAADDLAYKKARKQGAKISVYRCLRPYFKKSKPWGSLTGIRPTKLLRDLVSEHGMGKAKQIFAFTYDVSKEKIQLAAEIVQNQMPFINSVKQNDIDLYVGIPFCTSRCAYCSFFSAKTSKDGSVEHQYMDALLSELDALMPVITAHTVRSVYVGGGTPTALPMATLSRLMNALSPLAQNLEFTVEAGRPDTVTKEKLALLKEAGVNRISINPQSTCEGTLALIGRNHTVQEFLIAAEMAMGMGFAVVNMDLIAGLPKEDKTVFLKSVQDVIELAPQNITVHSLAIKRASTFGMENEKHFASAEQMEEMLMGAQELLVQAGYLPYYMYRQKYMAGSMENTGYAKKGAFCTYNIDMMEETTNILALGAGGASKRIYGGNKRIERYMGVKDIKNYLERLDELVEKKKKLFT